MSQPEPEPPSYEALLALSADRARQNEQLVAGNRELGELVAVLTAKVEVLQIEVAALRRQLGRDSSNSSQPPSQDGPAARARDKAAEKPRGRATGRRPGGQKGHRGTGLERVAAPDARVPVEPGACGGCGAGLAGAPGQVASSVQVFDIPTVALHVTEHLLMRRTCGCGHVTTAAPPPGVAGGPTCYGPNVVAAATLLASTDVIGIERTAELMAVLLGAPVSTGFVSRCLVRLDDALTAGGFEDALKDALRAADVIGTDETPAPLTDAATSGQDCHNPHVFTVRTMRTYTGCGDEPTRDLVWYGAAGDRTKASITAFGILDSYTGALVRDDYGGYTGYDQQLTAVQQCLAHLHRYLDDAYAIDPATQVWTRAAGDALREATTAVKAARAAGRTRLDPDLLAGLRRRYDQAVAVGISVNLSRRWHTGNHPGLVLAKRLRRKADQVWAFTTRFDIPATNNGSEHAIRGYKTAAKIKGCWRTLTTLQRHCRIRSYLTTARNHGHRPLDAIRDALTTTPWMPPTTA